MRFFFFAPSSHVPPLLTCEHPFLPRSSFPVAVTLTPPPVPARRLNDKPDFLSGCLPVLLFVFSYGLSFYLIARYLPSYDPLALQNTPLFRSFSLIRSWYSFLWYPEALVILLIGFADISYRIPLHGIASADFCADPLLLFLDVSDRFSNSP